MFAVVRQSLRRYYTAVIAEIAGTGSWLSDSGPVAAPAGNVLAAHTKIIHMLRT